MWCIIQMHMHRLWSIKRRWLIVCITWDTLSVKDVIYFHASHESYLKQMSKNVQYTLTDSNYMMWVVYKIETISPKLTRGAKKIRNNNQISNHIWQHIKNFKSKQMKRCFKVNLEPASSSLSFGNKKHI